MLTIVPKFTFALESSVRSQVLNQLSAGTELETEAWVEVAGWPIGKFGRRTFSSINAGRNGGKCTDSRRRLYLAYSINVDQKTATKALEICRNTCGKYQDCRGFNFRNPDSSGYGGACEINVDAGKNFPEGYPTSNAYQGKGPVKHTSRRDKDFKCYVRRIFTRAGSSRVCADQKMRHYKRYNLDLVHSDYAEAGSQNLCFSACASYGEKCRGVHYLRESNSDPVAKCEINVDAGTVLNDLVDVFSPQSGGTGPVMTSKNGNRYEGYACYVMQQRETLTPTSRPTKRPTTYPTERPTTYPTEYPTLQPSPAPPIIPTPPIIPIPTPPSIGGDCGSTEMTRIQIAMVASAFNGSVESCSALCRSVRGVLNCKGFQYTQVDRDEPKCELLVCPFQNANF